MSRHRTVVCRQTRPTTDERQQFYVDITPATDGRATVVVCGEVDLYTADQLHAALAKAVESGARQLTVDLSLVGFLDSTALGVLIAAAKLLPADDALDIVCPNEKIRRVFELTGLDGVFAIYKSRDEALGKLLTS